MSVIECVGLSDVKVAELKAEASTLAHNFLTVPPRWSDDVPLSKVDHYSLTLRRQLAKIHRALNADAVFKVYNTVKLPVRPCKFRDADDYMRFGFMDWQHEWNMAPHTQNMVIDEVNFDPVNFDPPTFDVARLVMAMPGVATNVLGFFEPWELTYLGNVCISYDYPTQYHPPNKEVYHMLRTHMVLPVCVDGINRRNDLAIAIDRHVTEAIVAMRRLTGVDSDLYRCDRSVFNNFGCMAVFSRFCMADYEHYSAIRHMLIKLFNERRLLSDSFPDFDLEEHAESYTPDRHFALGLRRMSQSWWGNCLRFDEPSLMGR